MAPKSLAQQIAELDDLTPRDFDPEDLDRGAQDSDDESVEVDANAGREHYQAVGKAKLRKEDPVNLGKKYTGSKVSRDALEAESDDDPFRARSSDEEEDDNEDEEDEDNELESDEDEDDSEDEIDGISEESEEEQPRKLKKVPKKAPKDADLDDMETDDSDDLEGDESLEDFDEDGFSDEEDDDDEDGEDEEDEDEEESDEDAAPKRRVKFDAGSKSDDRAELRQLMATDQKTIAATISQAAKADATKGKAVKQQRATFDALLNTRIKLQKGLTAINQLSIAGADPASLDGEAIKSAETAALTLWSTLEDLRLALADAQSQDVVADGSKKRKRPSPVSATTSSASLWKRMAALEADSVAHRRAVLDKWSLKVRGSNANMPNARGKLLGSSGGQQTITAVLDAHIASETGDRAVKRARQDAEADSDEVLIYDDTVFYQSLLRDLVEQRMSSSESITNGLDTLHLLPSRDVHPVTGMRKDKVKKEIDTRASKGRKMRYDVHEKLQNFMAPEDRASWTSHAREEFFASLLGRTASGLLMEEDEEDGGSEGRDSDEDREEGGLRLFRS